MRKCEHCGTEVSEELIKFPSGTAHTPEKCRDILEARCNALQETLTAIQGARKAGVP